MNTLLNKTAAATLAGFAVVALSNCAPQNNLQQGAAVGAGTGALLGAVIGNNVGDGDANRGALIGGVLGGLGGAAVGNNRDLEQGRGYTLQKQNQYNQATQQYNQYGQQQTYPQY